jgi:lipid-A-disaccharide synthase-like uncharacterized protein
MLKFTLTALFIGVELMSLYAYWPQVQMLLEKGARSEGFSLRSWLLWLAGGVIASLYAICLNEDPYLIFVCVADTLGVAAVFTLALQHRLRFAMARNHSRTPFGILRSQTGTLKRATSVWKELLK